MQRVVSPRERQILSLVAQGYQSKEIAEQLDIATQTVNTHVFNVMTRLDARSRTHAVWLLHQAGELAGETNSAG